MQTLVILSEAKDPMPAGTTTGLARDFYIRTRPRTDH